MKFDTLLSIEHAKKNTDTLSYLNFSRTNDVLLRTYICIQISCITLSAALKSKFAH